MTIETATYISDLNATLPAAGDLKSEGDDHIRLVKTTVKATFPNVTGAVTPTHTVINNLAAGTFPSVAVTGVTSVTDTSSNVLGYKGLPPTSPADASSLVTTQLGKMVVGAFSSLTVPNSVFARGDVITIYQDSASAMTITQGAGVTLRLAGTATTGSRTLAGRGVATILFNSTSEALVSGAGVS